MYLRTINKFGCHHSPQKNMRFKGRHDSLRKGLCKKAEKKNDNITCNKLYFLGSCNVTLKG